MVTRGSVVGIDIKIERAKKHICDLESRIRLFLDGKPYKVVRQDEPNGETTFRVRVVAQPPPEWGAVIGDVIHNLRSSLDYLVWQLVLANGKTPTRKTGFPICDNAKEFETHGLRMIKGMSDSAVGLVRALKPYKGGNDALWRLHELDIMDKHKLLIPVGVAHKAVILDFGREAGRMFKQIKQMDSSISVSLPVAMRPADRQYPLKDGAILFVIKSGVERDETTMNPQFSFEVAFGEGQVVKGEPILATFQQLADFVEGVIQPFRLLLAAG